MKGEPQKRRLVFAIWRHQEHEWWMQIGNLMIKKKKMLHVNMIKEIQSVVAWFVTRNRNMNGNDSVECNKYTL